MTRTKRMTAAVLTLVLLLNFAGCGAKNALFDQVSGAGKFAAESLTIYEEKGRAIPHRKVGAILPEVI